MAQKALANRHFENFQIVYGHPYSQIKIKQPWKL